MNETPSFTQSASGRMVLCAMVVKSTTSNLVGGGSVLSAVSVEEEDSFNALILDKGTENALSAAENLSFRQAVKVMPNPIINSDLYIEHPENATIRIFSPEGQLLYNQRAFGTQTNIDVAKLKANGLILVHISSGNDAMVFKVLVIE